MRSRRGEILQVLLFSVLFGFALHALGRDNVLFQLIEKFSKVLFGIVGHHHEARARSARSARWRSPSASTAWARSRRSAS